MYDRLMVAFDGTDPSRHALAAGIELAKRLGQPLRTISVVEDRPVYMAAGGSSPETMAEIRRSAEAFARGLEDEVQEQGRAAGVAIESESVYGRIVDEIVAAVGRHRVDTLIVGIRAHPGLVERLISHTAHDLAERSPCSVLGVK